MRSLVLFFNSLALRRIPGKSLKSLGLLFSIPTAATALSLSSDPSLGPKRLRILICVAEH